MKPIKALLSALAVAALLLTVPSCAFLRNSTPQKIALTTIGTLQTATIAAYDGYIDLVIKGKVRTNGVPRVSAAFNQFQNSTLAALKSVEKNTNAIAPASLVLKSQDVIILIKNWSN